MCDLSTSAFHAWVNTVYQYHDDPKLENSIPNHFKILEDENYSLVLNRRHGELGKNRVYIISFVTSVVPSIIKVITELGPLNVHHGFLSSIKHYGVLAS